MFSHWLVTSRDANPFYCILRNKIVFRIRRFDVECKVFGLPDKMEEVELKGERSMGRFRSRSTEEVKDHVKRREERDSKMLSKRKTVRREEYPEIQFTLKRSGME